MRLLIAATFAIVADASGRQQLPSTSEIAAALKQFNEVLVSLQDSPIRKEERQQRVTLLDALSTQLDDLRGALSVHDHRRKRKTGESPTRQRPKKAALHELVATPGAGSEASVSSTQPKTNLSPASQRLRIRAVPFSEVPATDELEATPLSADDVDALLDVYGGSETFDEGLDAIVDMFPPSYIDRHMHLLIPDLPFVSNPLDHTPTIEDVLQTNDDPESSAAQLRTGRVSGPTAASIAERDQAHRRRTERE